VDSLWKRGLRGGQEFFSLTANDYTPTTLKED